MKIGIINHTCALNTNMLSPILNDTWKLENIDAIYPNNIVSVYNRLGNKVFEAQKGSYNQMPWDGTFNGQELPVASYYYIIEYNDNTTENSNGIVTIVK